MRKRFTVERVQANLSPGVVVDVLGVPCRIGTIVVSNLISYGSPDPAQVAHHGALQIAQTVGFDGRGRLAERPSASVDGAVAVGPIHHQLVIKVNPTRTAAPLRSALHRHSDYGRNKTTQHARTPPAQTIHPAVIRIRSIPSSRPCCAVSPCRVKAPCFNENSEPI